MKNLDTYIGEGLLTSKEGPAISAKDTIEAALQDLVERNSRHYASRDISWEIEEDRKGMILIDVTCDKELRGGGIVMHDSDVRLLNGLYKGHPFRFRRIENLTLYKFDNGGRWPDWMQGTGFRDMYMIGTYARTITGFNVTFSYGDPDGLGLSLDKFSNTYKTPIFKNSTISAPEGFVIMLDYDDALDMFGPGFRIDCPKTAYNKFIFNGLYVHEDGVGKKGMALPDEVVSNVAAMRSAEDANRYISEYIGQWLTDNYRDVLRPFSEIHLNIQTDGPIGGKRLGLITLYYMWDLRNGGRLVIASID